MEDKKYYWLKLKSDFFKRHDIRIIESMPNGKDYELFYLKLLVESVKHSGKLRFSESIPYNEDMLATITNTNIDVVRMAIKVFSELNMMEIESDGTIYMREVARMTGFETKWAEKKRNYRLKKDTVHQLSTGSPPPVRQEIEIDKEIEIESLPNEVFKHYEQEIGILSPMVAQDLGEYVNDIGVELVQEAIKRSVDANVRKLKYVTAICENMRRSGARNLKDYIAKEQLTKGAVKKPLASAKVKGGKYKDVYQN